MVDIPYKPCMDELPSFLGYCFFIFLVGLPLFLRNEFDSLGNCNLWQITSGSILDMSLGIHEKVLMLLFKSSVRSFFICNGNIDPAHVTFPMWNQSTLDLKFHLVVVGLGDFL